MNKQKVKIMSVVAILFFLGFSTQTYSQMCCNNSNWNYNSGLHWWNSNTPEKYALSSDQVTKINSIRSSSSEKISVMQNKLIPLRLEYRKINLSSDYDINKLKSVRKEIRDLEDKISDVKLETKDQIKKVLSKEQLNYFNNDQYRWWNMADNCWYSGKSNMNYGGHHRMRSNHGCW
jgi:Spy/CpxP family protein refolding chaperone